MMKSKTTAKRVTVVITVTLVLLFTTITAYTAYLGRGSGKGVLVSSRRYFESNILQRITEVQDAITDQADKKAAAAGYPVSCAVRDEGSAVQTVEIRNHNMIGDYNANNIAYTVDFWIDGDDVNFDETDYTYSIIYNGTETQLNNGNTYKVSYNGSLNTGTRSADTYQICWTKTGGASDYTKACRVYAFAHPTSPTFMTSAYLGAVVSLSESEQVVQGFHVTCAFDEPENTLKNEAAFTYRITTAGSPPDENRLLTIRFNSDKLTLVDYLTAQYSTPVEETQGDPAEPTGYSTTTLPLVADSLTVLRFTRGPEWSSADEELNLNTFITPYGTMDISSPYITMTTP